MATWSLRAGKCTRLLAVGLLAYAPAFADYTVTGRFMYEDRPFDLNGFTGNLVQRPIRFAEVWIMAGNEKLASGATAADGTFSVVVPYSTAQQIKALCVTAANLAPGPLLDVRVAKDDFSPGDYYSVSSDAAGANGSGTVILPTILAASSTDAGSFFNIWDVLVDAEQFAASSDANRTFPPRKLTAIWRADHSYSGSFFVGGASPYLFVGSSSAWDDTVISHEFGHFIDYLYSRSDSPGGQHTIGDNRQDMRLSWSEGLATYLGSCSRKFHGYGRPEIYVATDGTKLSFSFEVEYLSGTAAIASTAGSTNELAVSAALWDVTDGRDTADSSPGSDDDPIQRPFSEVWKVLTQYFPTVTRPGITVETFWNGWFSPQVNNGSLGGMQAAFADVNHIEFLPDAEESDNSPANAPAIDVPRIPSPGSDGAGVVINEIEMGGDDAVELFNTGSADADITDWTLEAASLVFGTPGRTIWRIPPFRIPPGGIVILTEASGVNSNSTIYFNRDFNSANNIPWANGFPGSCVIRNAAGTAIDFVRWGGSTEPVPSGTGFSGPEPPSPPPDRTLGRDFSGSDSDSGSDWAIQISTFGTYNLSGAERHHTFYPAADDDYAAFNAVGGRSYIIETLNLFNAADTVVDLISTDGVTVLASGDDFGAWKSSRLLWFAPAGGRYYVRSRRFDGPSNPAEYGSYDLRVIESAGSFGLPVPSVLTVSQPGNGGRFQTVSEALAAASNGDTVQILDSATYRENLAISSSKSVNLEAVGGKNPVLDGRKSPGWPALNIANGKSVRIKGLTILGGSPGVLISGGNVTIADSLIDGLPNAGANQDNVQVRGSASEAAIVHCTIVNSGRYGVQASSSASVRVSNSILWNNAGGDLASDGSIAGLRANNSILATPGFAGTNGNMDVDPQFADPAGGNFRLRAGSPAIDRGDPAEPEIPAFDADGVPRCLASTSSGAFLPDMGAYEYLAPDLLSFSAFFPQVAVGGERNYRTSIVAMNTGAVATTANLSITRSNGEPFPSGVLSGPDSTWLTLSPYGSTSRETSTAADQISGYATISSSLPVSGTALFQTLSGSNIQSEAGVGLSKPARHFVVYIDNKRNAWSGYAVANPGPNPANLTLTLRDRAGMTKGTAPLNLPPGQQRAEFAAERFTAAGAEFEGTIEIAAGRDVCAVALRVDNQAQDVFSTIPVLADETGPILYFPQAADGSGYRTSLILVNPSNAAITARVEFFSDEGSGLELPIGGELRKSLEVALAGKGVEHLVTDGTSTSVRTGWVRVTASAAIGGAAIFQTLLGQNIKSEAGVASSPLAGHFTAYVESIGYAASGLAICNPNATPVAVSFYLRNTAGEVVATTALELPPLGHLARFFSGQRQLFPGFDQFQGTLEVIATGKVGAVALRYDNDLADVFATLPVVTLP